MCKICIKKKAMKKLVPMLVLLGWIFTACSNPSKIDLPDDSIYHLTSKWENQDGKFMQLDQLKGNVVVMVMIYTNCRTACPRLTADMRDIHNKVGNKHLKNMKYVLVSIDPEFDTPAKMKEYLNRYKFTGNEWLFLRSSEANTRELANVLAVKYKEISPIDFSHSNIISVFSKEGHLAYQKEGLNIDIDGTVSQIKEQFN